MPRKKKSKTTTYAVPTATVERHLEMLGTSVRLVITPARAGQVRILEYHRKRSGDARYRRVRSEEDQLVPFEQLQLAEGYYDLFPQAALF